MNEIQKYIAAHEPKMMDDLFSLIRIPSISALPEHHDDMLACAERWAQLLLEAGVDEALVMPLTGQSGCFRSKDREPGCKDCINLRSLRCDAYRTIGTLEKRTV